MAKRDVSASEEDPVRKSPRLAPSGTKKLAIFCQSMSDVEGFELYVVDMDKNSIYGGDVGEYSEINPRIRFTGGQHWEGCVLNSTLYIFEECKYKLRCIVKDKKSFDWGTMQSGYEKTGQPYPQDPIPKSVKKFVLSPQFLDSKNNTTVEIKDLDQLGKEFEEVSPMKWPKNNPLAVPTPDGKKILVFQGYIETECPWTCFELYDPELDLWTQLKPPLFPYHGSRHIGVDAYTFVDDSTLLLSTEVGNYLLDLESGNEKKEEKKNEKFLVADFDFETPDLLCRDMVSPHWVTIGGEVVIGTGWAFRLSDQSGKAVQLSPPPFVEPDPLFTTPSSITRLHLDAKYIDTLVSQVHECGDSHAYASSYVTIDACRTNLCTLETTTLGTLKYIVFRGGALFSLYMFII